MIAAKSRSKSCLYFRSRPRLGWRETLARNLGKKLWHEFGASLTERHEDPPTWRLRPRRIRADNFCPNDDKIGR